MILTKMAVESFDLMLDIGYMLLAATLLAFIARYLRQPLILAYVLAGIIIGPYVLGIVHEHEAITTLAHLGIASLLFMVGLELDMRRLKDVGKVSLGCGLGQIIITFIFGYLLTKFLGFDDISSFYIAFALTISSTMVVIKLLSDQNELDTLHGKIVLGTLLVQDVVTIMVITVITTKGGLSITTIAEPILRGFGLVCIAIVFGGFLIPPILKTVARSPELLFLSALSWCFVFTAFAFHIGFESVEIGAFLAGVSLATFPYNLEIIGRIRSLRDFFSTIFFVSLGLQVPLTTAMLITLPLGDLPLALGDLLPVALSDLTIPLKLPLTLDLLTPAIILSLFVLIGNTLIMIVISTLFGYGKRTSFLTALSLAQISEFSLILVSVGSSLGHISNEIFSLVVFIAVVTITGSSYFIINGGQLYKIFLPALRIFGSISNGKELEEIPLKSKKHIVVCGCHRMGNSIVQTLRALKKDFLVVDLNPDIIRLLIDRRIPCIYGDIGDMEILERINLKDADIVISTIPNQEDNLLLIQQTKKLNPSASIFIAANHLDQALELYDVGADYVILPHILAGEKISEYLKESITDRCRIMNLKKDHIHHLEDVKREELLERYESSILKSLEKKFNGRFRPRS